MSNHRVALFLASFALLACTGKGEHPSDVEAQPVAGKTEPGKVDSPPPPIKPVTPPKDPHDFRRRAKQIPAPADVAAVPADATKTDSGLAFKVLEAGTGDAAPGPNDSVRVEYTGWTTDGGTFDTTEGRGPRTFPVSKGLPGWTEALQQMKVGEKRRLWLPPELAYQGRPHGPQGMLVFDMKLLEVLRAPEVPADVAAPPADAKKTPGGVAYESLERGEGKKHPRKWDEVTVHYSGWTTDGQMFDSSITKGKPATFRLDRVIPGWTEGIPQMVRGEKMRFWLPKELAYDGQPGRPQGMLVFDVELLEIKELPEPPPPPEVPKDVAAPPADAEKTESGLAYKVLKAGEGNRTPKPTDRVKVHYSGWTTDGKMFDSSVTRGTPATFPLQGVIKGWTEGLQTMKVGGKTRFWIPKELAYGDRPGKPQGMLVFDVELLEIL